MTSEKKIRTFHLKKREALYALGTHFLSGRRLYPQPNKRRRRLRSGTEKWEGRRKNTKTLSRPIANTT